MNWVVIAFLIAILAGLAIAAYRRRSNRAGGPLISTSPAKPRTDTKELEDLRRDFRNCFLREDQRERYLRLYRGKHPDEGEAGILRRILFDHAKDNR